MISFKHFILEKLEQVLYQKTTASYANMLIAGRSIPVKDKFTSFVRDLSSLKSEFGLYTLGVNVQELPENVKIIDVQYDLAWFTQDKLHREILMYVTGRTEQDWLDEFNSDIDEIENEMEAIYGDEKEVIVMGLKSFDSKVFKVINDK